MKKILLPFALLCLISCNKDFGNYFDQDIPDFSNQDIEDVQIIAKEDALFSFLSLVADADEDTLTDVGCIEFIYPFILFRFDETANFLDQVVVTGNENFTNVLDGLNEGYSIGLSYPISGNLFDGTSVTVNNNEELQQSLQTCIEEELEIIIGSCNAIVEECVWKITESDPEGSIYIDSFFTLEDDGSILFSVLQTHYPMVDGEEENHNEEMAVYEDALGTWIFYYIGPDLHLNINFGPIEEDENGFAIPQDSVKSDWNFDWKVKRIENDIIKIEKSYTETVGTDTGEVAVWYTEEITLEKQCDEESPEDEVQD